jgi:hypothetical protein
MKIKNVSHFLASATLVVCTTLGMAQSALSNEVSVNPEAPTSIQNNVDQLPFLDGVNVEGHSVRMLKERDLPAAMIKAMQEQSGGGALRMNTRDGSILCSVTVEEHADAPGLPGAIYYKISTQDAENILIDRNAYDFFMASHEISHCFNHASQASNRQLLNLEASPHFAPYVPILRLIDSSIRETYADFSAVLLGASKTGDWAVFSKAVMPFRASMPDIKHMTLNATANLINGIDPASLKGMTFEQVNAFANQQFKKRFMNASGEIDMRSPGVLDVVSEFAYTGERLRLLSTIDVYKADATLYMNISDLVRGFGSAVYTKPIAKAEDFAFISALYVVDAKVMGRYAATSPANSAQGSQLANSLERGMAAKERLDRSIDEYLSKALFKQPSQINRYIASVQTWQQRTTTPGSERLLGQKLQDFIAENVRLDDSQGAHRVGLEGRIQERLSAVRSSTGTGMVSPAVSWGAIPVIKTADPHQVTGPAM